MFKAEHKKIVSQTKALSKFARLGTDLTKAVDNVCDLIDNRVPGEEFSDTLSNIAEEWRGSLKRTFTRRFKSVTSKVKRCK